MVYARATENRSLERFANACRHPSDRIVLIIVLLFPLESGKERAEHENNYEADWRVASTSSAFSPK